MDSDSNIADGVPWMREMNLFTSKYSTQGKQSQGWMENGKSIKS